jgi:hypothetical protein
MRFCSLAGLGLLLLCSATWAQVPAPKPWRPDVKPSQPTPLPTQQTSPRGKDGKPLHFYGIPDTGQFLPDSAVIGHIDERIFRVFEFRERWYAAYMLDRPKTDSAGRFEFLNSMVNKEVLAALAREVNRPFTFEDRAKVREVQQRMLSNAVFARLVADSARVTRDEVQHIYDQGRLRLHVQHIVADDPATVEHARADVLARRLSWPLAVKKYSTGRGDKGPDGDLGWVERTYFDPVPALEIFDLADGRISGIFRSNDGWQFIQVLGRRVEAQPVFDVVARGLANEVREVKIAGRVEQIREQIRKRIGMAYDSTNITWAAALFAENERQSQSTSSGPVIDLGGALPEFQPADTARVLARWKDGRYTLGGFLAAYNAISPLQRDKIGTFSTFRSTLDRFVFEPYMAELGLEHGLDRDPLVTSQVARQEEQIRVEHLFADSVESRLWITPQERRQYYQDHLQNYATWQNVQFAALVRPSRAGADSLAARLKAGESAVSILRTDSLGGINSGSIRSMREDERGQPYYKILFEEMRPGNVEVVGPDKQGDYLVLQKLAHEPSRQMSYEEVQGLVDESVQNVKAEQALKQFVARHRGKHRIELHPELLLRIRLTDPRDD